MDCAQDDEEEEGRILNESNVKEVGSWREEQDKNNMTVVVVSEIGF